MFTNLTRFGYERTSLEAFGFYVAYLGGFFLLTLSLGTLVDFTVSDPVISLRYSRAIGLSLAIAGPIVISLLILQKKQLLSRPLYLAVALLSAGLGFFGVILGLIPAAYLSMQPSAQPIVPLDRSARNDTVQR